MNFRLLKYLFLVLINILPCRIYSQVQNDPPKVEARIYKTVGLTTLKLFIFQPSVRKDGERLPAIVFFFGGGWQQGDADQFIPQCKYFAERGMVAITADYRVKNRQGVMPFECVADAKSAIRWIRTHADELGIDGNRIAAGGGSAGGHLAACTGLIKDFDEIKEDLSISSVPNALVLFNPVLDVPEIVYQLPKEIEKALEGRATEISPIHHVSTGAPPTIIFHGTADATVPFHQAIRFSEEMNKYGNRCEIVPFEGLMHGFFNYNNGENPAFFSTMEKSDKFLISIGYLKEETNLK
jgi:acetyl esterase